MLGPRTDRIGAPPPRRLDALDEGLDVGGREAEDQLVVVGLRCTDELEERERPSARIGRQEGDLADGPLVDRRLDPLVLDQPAHRLVEGCRLLEVVDQELAEAELRVGGAGVRHRVRHGQRGTIPPSTKTTCPVMKLPASEVRSSAGPTISSGSAMRLMIWISVIRSCASAGFFRTMSV